jgi:hypothetical protein
MAASSVIEMNLARMREKLKCFDLATNIAYAEERLPNKLP